MFVGGLELLQHGVVEVKRRGVEDPERAQVLQDRANLFGLEIVADVAGLVVALEPFQRL